MDPSQHKLIILKELRGNAPTHLDPIQKALEPHAQLLINTWIAIWCVTAIVILAKLGREYLEHRRKQRGMGHTERVGK